MNIPICANCFQKITKDDELVRCVNSGQLLHKDCANPCVKCGNPLTDTASIANKFTCNECIDDNVVQIDAIRRSHIEDYKVCPYKFKLLVIDKREQDNNPYAESGIILHDIFDKASNDKSITKEDMIDEYTLEYAKIDSFKEYQITKNVPKTLYEKGLIAIENFVKYNLTAPEPFATENTIYYTISDDVPKIQITFDRINKIDGKLHLVDYKTGNVYVGKRLANDLQIPTYILAVKEHYGQLPETFTLLFFAEDKERVYRKINDKEYVCTVGKRNYTVNLEDKIREINSIFSRIKQGRFELPVGNLAPWYCQNRCGVYEKYCNGIEDEPWKRLNE